MQKHKHFKKIILTTLTLILTLFLGFIYWANDYYHAEESVIKEFETDETIKTINNLTIIEPLTKSDTGIIFYPGAKVEAIAYLPLLQKLKENGLTCVIVKMPLNMAIFDVNAANKVPKTLPNIKKWYISGHSMGGAMASVYAQKNSDKIQGLILMGAYIYGDYPPNKTLTIYGSFNSNLEKNISYTENIIKIEGGNHAQFGNYGKQKNDPDATISSETQQNITVKAILEFLSVKP